MQWIQWKALGDFVNVLSDDEETYTVWEDTPNMHSTDRDLFLLRHIKVNLQGERVINDT